MTSQEEIPTGKEMGLMKNLSKRNSELYFTVQKKEALMEKSSKTIMKYGGITAIKEFRIDYGGNQKAWFLTTIGDYKNKKGVVSKAHYTKFGKYYGSVKKLGDEPILHLTWVDITNETLDIYWTVNIDTGLLIPVERPIV